MINKDLIILIIIILILIVVVYFKNENFTVIHTPTIAANNQVKITGQIAVNEQLQNNIHPIIQHNVYPVLPPNNRYPITQNIAQPVSPNNRYPITQNIAQLVSPTGQVRIVGPAQPVPLNGQVRIVGPAQPVPLNGQVRLTRQLETLNNIQRQISPNITVTGGYKIVEKINYKSLYEFYDNGTFTLSAPTCINFFMIGGGGGGSMGEYGQNPLELAGTGGNSGYVLYNTSKDYILPVGTYNIQIGQGGVGGGNHKNNDMTYTFGSDGTASIISLDINIIVSVSGGNGGKNPKLITPNSQKTYCNYSYNGNNNTGLVLYDSKIGQTENNIGTGHYYNFGPISSVIGKGGSGGAAPTENSNQIQYGDGGTGGQGGGLHDNTPINYNGYDGKNGCVYIWIH
jgi:hypothetical protein